MSGCGSPVSSHSKVAGSPSTTVMFLRGLVISGAVPVGFFAVKTKCYENDNIALYFFNLDNKFNTSGKQECILQEIFFKFLK